MVSMDQLYALFGASFDPNPNNRKAAELELRAIERQEGTLPAAFELVKSDQADFGHRQAAAIWVKNRVRRGWDLNPADPTFGAGVTGKDTPISEADKMALKVALLPTLATLEPRLRVHVMSTLLMVIPNNFPTEWPELLPSIQQALHSGDGNTIAAGARALLVTARRMRWTSSDDIVELTCSQTFPQLLQLARTALDAPNAASDQSIGDLVHIIIKTYFRATQHMLAAHLQESIVSWGAVFLATVGKQLDDSVLPEDPDEKAASPWWKTKKWAYRVLNKLYRRYGNPNQMLSNMKQYKPFATTFSAQFAPEILRAYLRQTELAVGGQFLSQVCKFSMFEFYTDCVMAKGLWSLIKPNLQTIVETFAFPTLCLTQDDIEKFEDEPITFIREQMDPTEEYGSAAGIAFDFVRTAVSKRKSATFHPILNFLQTVMHAAASGERSPIEKEGALRLSGAMCLTMVNDDNIGSQLDNFMSSQVLPELGNKAQPLLQFRAAEVIKSFDAAGMEWSNPATLETACRGVLDCFTDESAALPVRLQAAAALGELIGHDDVHTACAPHAGRLMQQLLSLSDRTDLDVLLRTQEKVVDNFATELLPFAVDLAAQLRDSFIRLVNELIQASQSIEESGDISTATPDAENQMFAAMASLSTMYQLVSAADNNKEILAQLEATLLPALIFALENERNEFMDEMYDLIEILSYNQQVTSPLMWRVFELTSQALLDWGADFISEVQTPLSNIITFGAATVAQNPAYKKALVDIYTSQWQREADDQDLIEVCKLANTMLLRVPGAWDAELPQIMEPVVRRSLAQSVPSASSRRWSDIVLLDTFIYNAPLALQLLSSQGVLAPVLQSVLPRVPNKFAREHEVRVGIMSFLTLLGLPAETMPAEVQAAAPLLLSGVVQLLAKYPEVVSRKKQLGDLLEEDLEDLLDDEDGAGGLEEDIADDKDVKNEANELYEMIIAASNKRREREERRAAIAAGESVPDLPDDDDDDDEDDDPDDDDAIYESALDQVRIYDAFRTWRSDFPPQAFDTLLAQLPAEMQGSLATVSEMKDDEIAALAEADEPKA